MHLGPSDKSSPPRRRGNCDRTGDDPKEWLVEIERWKDCTVSPGRYTLEPSWLLQASKPEGRRIRAPGSGGTQRDTGRGGVGEVERQSRPYGRRPETGRVENLFRDGKHTKSELSDLECGSHRTRRTFPARALCLALSLQSQMP